MINHKLVVVHEVCPPKEQHVLRNGLNVTRKSNHKKRLVHISVNNGVTGLQKTGECGENQNISCVIAPIYFIIQRTWNVYKASEPNLSQLAFSV